MKLTRIALSTATVLTAITSTATNSQAQTQVNQALDILNSAPAGEPTFTLCADQGYCTLPSTAALTTGEGTAPNINNNVNDLGEPITGLIFQILSPNAEWGTVTSNAFNVTISPDGKTASFSEATIFPGQVYRIERTVSDGSPVDYVATAVPEPVLLKNFYNYLDCCALVREKTFLDPRELASSGQGHQRT